MRQSRTHTIVRKFPDAGSVSHEEAEAKALGEYEKFWRIQDKTILSDFDRFIEGLDKV